jgi:hypothetical protein
LPWARAGPARASIEAAEAARKSVFICTVPQ